MRTCVAVFVAVCVVSGGCCFAAIPQMMNYQGKLTAAAGTLLANGQYDMVFGIYSAETGGTQKWTETWDSSTSQVQVSNGLFNVLLGAHEAITLPFDEFYWLEMQVKYGGSYETLLPRQQIVSGGYAYRAEKVTDGAITDASISPSAAIADTKLATISTAGKVSGAAVSGSITGNAATATKLAATKTINGVAFDGSGNITVPSDIAALAAGNVLTSNGSVWTSAAPAFTGAASSTDNAIARFDSTTGAVVQNSGLTISDLGGQIDLNSVVSSGTGVPWIIKAGACGATSRGADVYLSAGNGGATSGGAGDLYLTGGFSKGAGDQAGSVIISSGGAWDSNRGYIYFYPYTGATYGLLHNVSSIASSDKTVTWPNTTGTVGVMTSSSTATTFTFNGTGSPGTSASVTLRYQRIGDVVTIFIPAVNATTGTNSFEFSSNTAIDAGFRPATGSQHIYVGQMQGGGGSFQEAGLFEITSGGIIRMHRNGVYTAWANGAATSGLQSQTSMTYYVGTGS